VKHQKLATNALRRAYDELAATLPDQDHLANLSHFSSSGEGKDAVAGQLTHRHPVESVSWFDAISFCNKLSALERRRPCYVTSGSSVAQFPGNGYRLPTEAEWEYACRAGSTGAYCFSEASELNNNAWCHVNSAGMTHPVGMKLPNGFGAYDMHGNVWEWCWDWYDAKSYEQRSGVGDVVDPFGPAARSLRVRRGGCWLDLDDRCRSACRRHLSPGDRFSYIGFRLAMTIDAAKQKTPLTLPTDRDRAAAEWVLGIGGTITARAGNFKASEELPQQPFRIIGIVLQTNKQVTDAGLEHLKELTKLKVINLNGNPQLSDECLEYLKGLANLERLYIGGTEVSDTGLEHLKGLTNLTYVLLKGTNVTPAGVADLKKALPN